MIFMAALDRRPAVQLVNQDRKSMFDISFFHIIISKTYIFQSTLTLRQWPLTHIKQASTRHIQSTKCSFRLTASATSRGKALDRRGSGPKDFAHELAKCISKCRLLSLGAGLVVPSHDAAKQALTAAGCSIIACDGALEKVGRWCLCFKRSALIASSSWKVVDFPDVTVAADVVTLVDIC